MRKREKQQGRADYLNNVQRQLRRLEPREQREILAEVAGHIQDAETSLRAGGADLESAHLQAIASMGDPTMVGRRLQAAHLRQRLPLAQSLLAGLPVVLFTLVVLATPLWYTGFANFRLSAVVRNGDLQLPLTALLPAMALYLLDRPKAGVWGDTVVGIAGVLSIITLFSTHTAEVSWRAILVLAALTAVGATVFALRRGSLAASIALLAAVGGYALYAWLYLSPSVSAVGVCATPFLAIAAVCATPRHWRAAVTWVALAAEWLLVATYAAIDLRSVPEATARGFPTGPSDMLSLPIIAASVGLLVVVQATGAVHSRVGVRGGATAASEASALD